MDLLIKGGTVVTASSSFKADVAVKNGKISAIGANLKPDAKTEVVDAKGKLVLPGAIDGHTHLAMPFGGTIATDDYHTGTRAAACRKNRRSRWCSCRKQRCKQCSYQAVPVRRQN